MGRTLLAILTLALVAPPSGPGGASDGTPEIRWHTIAGGGGVSAGADIQVSGTIGQWEAGVASGDGFTLTGGFWVGGAPGAPPCPEDVDGDGLVAVGDLLAVLAQWGGPGSADVNGDGVVDVADLLAVLAAWGLCPV